MALGTLTKIQLKCKLLPRFGDPNFGDTDFLGTMAHSYVAGTKRQCRWVREQRFPNLHWRLRKPAGGPEGSWPEPLCFVVIWRRPPVQLSLPFIGFYQGCGITRGLSNHFCDTRESPFLNGGVVFGGPFYYIAEVGSISHSPAAYGSVFVASAPLLGHFRQARNTISGSYV